MGTKDGTDDRAQAAHATGDEARGPSCVVCEREPDRERDARIAAGFAHADGRDWDDALEAGQKAHLDTTPEAVAHALADAIADPHDLWLVGLALPDGETDATGANGGAIADVERARRFARAIGSPNPEATEADDAELGLWLVCLPAWAVAHLLLDGGLDLEIEDEGYATAELP